MYDGPIGKLVPVPASRDLTPRERKLEKFSVGERVWVKGMAFVVEQITETRMVLGTVRQK